MKVRNLDRKRRVRVAGFVLLPSHSVIFPPGAYEKWLKESTGNQALADECLYVIPEIEPKLPDEAPDVTAILEAVRNVPTDDSRNWTADGAPTINAVQKLVPTGVDVTARDRDAAWEIVKAEREAPEE